jgi:GLPGLI family protein
MLSVIKVVIIMVLVIVPNQIIAQDFQGVAIYKSHRKVDLKINDDKGNSEMQKQIQEQLKKQFQQEYTLTFNKNESVYKQNEKLDAPTPSQSGFKISIGQNDDVLYKNIQEHRFANKTDIFGKLFLIKDTLVDKKWELVNETKYIGEYTCFKAVYTEDYTTQTLTETGGMEKVTKQRTTTVWYTPQIPVSHGPANYFGLPGLILEVNDGDTTLVCSKIVINPKELANIEEPQKGKEVNQTEFDEIREKKNKEMIEKFQTRSGSSSGDNIVIKIGG